MMPLKKLTEQELVIVGFMPGSSTTNNKLNIESLIKSSSDVVGSSSLASYLDALENPSPQQSIWTASINGEYVGWASAGLCVEQGNSVFVSLELFSIYVLPQHRNMELGELLAEQIALDTAQTVATLMTHQSLDSYFDEYGDDADLIDIEIEVSAACVSSGGHSVVKNLTYRFEKMLEKSLAKLPYGVSSSISLVEEFY